MSIRLRHLLHSGVVLAVALQLGFGVSFLLDAHRSDQAYQALVAHHVRVPARVLSCGRFLAGTRPRTYEHACLVSYSFRGQSFSDVIPYDQPKAFYIDPLDPSDRMSVGYFAGGPTGHTGDIVIASLLFTGAALVIAVHQWHMSRRRRALRGRGS